MRPTRWLVGPGLVALASSLTAPAAVAQGPQSPQWRPGIPLATDVAKLPLGGFAEYDFRLDGQAPWRQKFSLVGRDQRAQHIEALVEGGPLGPGSQALMRIEVDPAAQAVHRVRRLVVRAGPLAAMEFPAGDALAKDQFAPLDPGKLVGDRSVTVPAGTFKTRYYKDQLAGGDTIEYWVDPQVAPFGIVKLQASYRGRGPLVMQLSARGTGARASLTEQARPHDPTIFSREVMTVAQGGALPAHGPDDTTVINNVHVVTMNGDRVREAQTVVVKGDRIVSVDRRKVKMPDGTEVIDGTGKYLMPGLAEMHGHIPPLSAAAYAGEVLLLYAANGITTVRGMLGHPGQLELREAAVRGDIISPTLYLAGPSFNGQSIESPEQAVSKVRQQKKEGWDLLKVHPGLTRDEYDAMARTAREEKIRFGGHVPADVGLLHALEMGQETFDHVDGYVEYLEGDRSSELDARKLTDVVSRTRKAGAWIVPTMALWEVLQGTLELKDLRAYPELRYVQAQDVEQWTRAYQDRLERAPRERARNIVASRLRILRALNEGGAKILMGTDAPQQFSVPGFSLHRELQWMRKAGMTPAQILASGTRNVGAYFKSSDRFGTVAPGQRADLVLLEANPLADVANVDKIAGVMLRGRWLSRADIDARLGRIADKYRR
jgi:imidazolonepropionase-like amidohydrolase